MMQKKPDWLSGLVTARATVMAPLLMLHLILLLFSVLIFYHSIIIGSIFIFLIWTPVLIYTLWRHEQWATKAPWLLTSEKIALHDTDLYGTNEQLVPERDNIDLEVVPNPAQKTPKPSMSKSKETRT